MDRRATLGSVSQSTLNSRASRPSLAGGNNLNNTNADISMMKSRASMGIPANRILNIPGAQNISKRSSMGVVNSRKSSLQPRGSSITTIRVTDPRNISEKQFLNESIRTLLKYLTEHNFDHAISPKILSRPSNKDFSNIVLFLFKQYDTNFTLTGKFEDEVVSMFKQIGYPCSISKANISAAGTPHAWPSLLAALVWLVELLQYDDAICNATTGVYSNNNTVNATMSLLDSLSSSSSSTSDTADDKSLIQTAFYSYLSQAYSLFMLGEDDRYTELEEKFINKFQSKNILVNDQIIAIEQRNTMLNNEIEVCENRRLLLPELEKRKKESLLQLSHYQTLVDQAEKNKNAIYNKVTSRQYEYDKLMASITELNAEISVLQNQILHQELSPEDVKRMNTQKEQLEKAMTQASEHKYMQQEKVRECENNLRMAVEKLNDTTRNYNLIAEDLKLIPITARNSKNQRFEIVIDIKAKKREDLLKTDIRESILPLLLTFRKDINEITTQLKSDLHDEKDDLKELIVSETEWLSKMKEMEKKLEKMEILYKQEKEISEANAQRCRQEIDNLEAKLLRRRDTTDNELQLTKLTNRLTELKQIKSTNSLNYEKTKTELLTAIMDVVTLCANHKELVQSKLKFLKDLYTEKVEDCLLQRGMHGAIKNAIANATGHAATRARLQTERKAMEAHHQNRSSNMNDSFMEMQQGLFNQFEETSQQLFRSDNLDTATTGTTSGSNNYGYTNQTRARPFSMSSATITTDATNPYHHTNQHQHQQPSSRMSMPVNMHNSKLNTITEHSYVTSTTTNTVSAANESGTTGSKVVLKLRESLSSQNTLSPMDANKGAVSSPYQHQQQSQTQAQEGGGNKLLSLLEMNHRRVKYMAASADEVHILEQSGIVEVDDYDDDATIEINRSNELEEHIPAGGYHQQQRRDAQYVELYEQSVEGDQQQDAEGETTDYSRLAGDANYSRLYSDSYTEEPSNNVSNRVTMRTHR